MENNKRSDEDDYDYGERRERERAYTPKLEKLLHTFAFLANANHPLYTYRLSVLENRKTAATMHD